jgi:hypothetical protein
MYYITLHYARRSSARCSVLLAVFGFSPSALRSGARGRAGGPRATGCGQRKEVAWVPAAHWLRNTKYNKERGDIPYPLCRQSAKWMLLGMRLRRTQLAALAPS